MCRVQLAECCGSVIIDVHSPAGWVLWCCDHSCAQSSWLSAVIVDVHSPAGWCIIVMTRAPSSWLIIVLLWWCMCTVQWADSWITVMAHVCIPAGWVLHCITSVTGVLQVKIATGPVEAGYKNPLFLIDKVWRFLKATGSSLHVLFCNKWYFPGFSGHPALTLSDGRKAWNKRDE